MSSRKLVAQVGKGGGKPDSMSNICRCPLWSNVRFASPPGLKEDNL